MRSVVEMTNLKQFTSALHGGRRPEGRPELLGAQLAACRHMEANLHKLVPLNQMKLCQMATLQPPPPYIEYLLNISIYRSSNLSNNIKLLSEI